MPVVVVAMDTDIGRRRKQNQDAIGHMVPPDPDVLARLGQIFVLADGVGGLSGGDLASQYAVSTIISSYYDQEEGDPAERLARAIAEANNLIYAEGQGQETPSIMATTVVTAVLRGRELVIGSVGDSPAYLMRDARARKLTLDHTVESMQREAGTPLPDGDPSGRKLVRALGGMPSVKVDIISGRVRDGDHIVLCSDGLTRYVSPEEIERTVSTLPPQRAVKALIEMANERGGSDNISVIVLRLAESGDVIPQAPIPTLIEEWGDSRREISRPSAPGARSARARVAASQQRDNPVGDLWHFFRGKAILTGIGLMVLLVAFVAVLLVVQSRLNPDDEPAGSNDPTTAPTDARAANLTADFRTTMTAEAVAVLTTDALQVAEAAQAATTAALSMTPPPTAGPQMVKDDWFRLLPGEPVETRQEPDLNAEPATPLEAGANYLIQEVNTEAWNGPWYWVVDNQGTEVRWVNAPRLHQRVLRVSLTGEPLPSEQQPTDIAPPTPPATPTSTLRPTITPPPDADSTEPAFDEGTAEAGEPAIPPAPTLPVEYPADNWPVGTVVYAKAEFNLRETPSLAGAETDAVVTNEASTVMQAPVAADGHWWWRVRLADGRTGWVAQPLLSFAPVQ